MTGLLCHRPLPIRHRHLHLRRHPHLRPHPTPRHRTPAQVPLTPQRIPADLTSLLQITQEAHMAEEAREQVKAAPIFLIGVAVITGTATIITGAADITSLHLIGLISIHYIGPIVTDPLKPNRASAPFRFFSRQVHLLSEQLRHRKHCRLHGSPPQPNSGAMSTNLSTLH